ncbi:GDP-mannose mannosyl hydrolase [Ningiella sp. W23]|uniref:GDP-mannose mannosyl hydrolase n=1 Tax=Ningiella sp. W23 TaxID=3023715 RepID=UPI0037563E92
MFLDASTFKTVIEFTPLISIDLIVQNLDGKILLGKRNNAPAKDFWFVPGGRILKDELMEVAFIRLAQEELGLDIALSDAKFLGAYEHFYDDCVFSSEISTHYVVLAYSLQLQRSLINLPTKQHRDYRWFSPQEMLNNRKVHRHSTAYLAALD